MTSLNFLNPNFLWLLPLALVPWLAARWLSPSPRSTEWGPMRVLERAIAARRKVGLRSRTLSALLQCFAVAALITAIAAPQLSSNAKIPGEELGSPEVLIALDRSASMRAKSDSGTRFEDAITELTNRIESAGDTSRFLIAASNFRGETELLTRSSIDRSRTIEVLHRLKPTYGTLDAEEFVGEIEKLCHGATDSRDQVSACWVASDFERGDWTSGAINGLSLLKAEAIRVGQPIVNVGIDSIILPDRVAIAGDPLDVTVEISTDAAASGPTNRRVFFDYNGRRISAQANPTRERNRQVASIQIPTNRSAAALPLRVSIPDDAFPPDNNRYRVVPLHDQISVLIVESTVTGDDRSGRFTTEALRAAERFGGAEAPFEIRRTASAGDVRSLSSGGVIVVTSPSRITPAEWESIAQKVSAGTGLIVGLAESTNLSQFGIPVRSEAPVQVLDDGSVFELRNTNAQHPILTNIGARSDGWLTADFVTGFVPMMPVESPDVSIDEVLELSNGQPFLVTGALGRGRFAVVTTSLDTDLAGPWPVWGNSYLPLLQETVRYVANGHSIEDVAVGESVSFVLPGTVSGSQVSIRCPDGKARSAEWQADVGPEGEYRFSETQWPGCYEVLSQSGEVLTGFAVQVSRGEEPTAIADLSPLGPADRGGWSFVQADVLPLRILLLGLCLAAISIDFLLARTG
ncbi:vWA domain-containing protein [Stratiformator vulcanicus]|uniref:Aerotolerance regulator N-terminal domain-containing protein n=1 Tax=Stratiformator vulcanicus TaxID=2527980 RepID=A0A517R7G4_9PLAN|nr:BatA and WFA domain-containing protein [Stratiformator vulcanicus]QDT39828.1 hypothetical protein Pan189_42400 [Stratiformator vulcanicus]